ncbi:hypothetical protein BDW02DRAFT_241152 [Decorospora gaudefroyi]|uniref:Uncharacterized protein n=1 Tax=Decorospora gaudefroyi TaxID=184978 RepID=A0A6A5KKG6_9PLEO|nr:hypothetical protein BDW02DRAFT_241152 [Decorospora gaudefroyi]
MSALIPSFLYYTNSTYPSTSPTTSATAKRLALGTGHYPDTPSNTYITVEIFYLLRRIMHTSGSVGVLHTYLGIPTFEPARSVLHDLNAGITNTYHH